MYKWTVLLIAGLTFAAGDRAWAQDYPNRPIRFVVPFTPGGSIDIVGRIVAKELSESLKVPISVDNRPGAGGNLGAEIVVKSSPDGYSVLLCVLPHAVYPSLYRKRSYDPLNDLAPISLAASFYLVLSVHPSLPIRSVQEFVRLAKSRPGEISYGSAGVGSPPHLAAEMLRAMTDISMTHISYKGNPQAQLDLMSGEIQMVFINLANALPLMQSRRVRGLAITSAQRSQLAPDIPTLAEQGLPEFVFSGWAGFCAPARTPETSIARLNSEIMNALQSPAVTKQLLAQGFELTPLPTAKFRAYFRAEIAKYAKVIRDAKISPQ